MTNEFLRTSKGKNDECYTPRYGVEPLLEFMELFEQRFMAPVEFSSKTLTSPLLSSDSPCGETPPSETPLRRPVIWCPFDTQDSEYVKVFKENGFTVVYSHIKYGQDFYNYEPEKWDVIISNPPFTGKTKIFERALSFKKPFALLMTITWLNDATPAKTFGKEQLQILSFDERMEFKNRSKEKQINFMSAYFCHNFLPRDFIFRSLKENNKQLKLL